VKPLLERQLSKYLPDIDPTQPPWRDFLAAVQAAYTEFQNDRSFLEHTLEVTSSELTDANEKLRREAERQIASLSRYYEQTLESQQGMILCVQRTPRGFKHTLCRGQLLARLGLEPADLENRLVDEIAPPEQAAKLNAAFARAWAGDEHAFSHTTIDGFELFISLRPRIENGTVVEIIAACVEITPLKEAERELRAAKERAEAADRAKSEFLAVMSHEIRTPLNAVLGFAALLQQSPLTADQHAWLRTIASSGETLLALINDILDFSKIEAGRLSLNLAPVPLSSLLDAVTSMFVPRAAAKGLSLELHCAPDLPDAISTDGQRLQQILINLVGNAVKFTSHGHVRLNVRQETPATSAAEDMCVLRFEIEDTGLGIPENQRDRLFKPFTQVDSSTTRIHGGTGLGLAICDRLVRMLGGEIGFESKLGEGSRFSFTIRAQPVRVEPTKPLPTSAPVDTALRRLRVLVAEDHLHNRLFMRHALEAHGVIADLVENGREAVDAVRTRSYDLVLMDLQMPEMDGFEATNAIRADAELWPQPRIYALTANVFPEDRKRCAEAGMDGMLTKPLELKQLSEVLESLQPKRAS
jgi:signal transduction histidine kinase